jgi:hypothetical protein
VKFTHCHRPSTSGRIRTLLMICYDSAAGGLVHSACQPSVLPNLRSYSMAARNTTGATVAADSDAVAVQTATCSVSTSCNLRDSECYCERDPSLPTCSGATSPHALWSGHKTGAGCNQKEDSCSQHGPPVAGSVCDSCATTNSRTSGARITMPRRHGTGSIATPSAPHFEPKAIERQSETWDLSLHTGTSLSCRSKLNQIQVMRYAIVALSNDCRSDVDRMALSRYNFPPCSSR